MKKTIFGHILIATLLPVFFILLAVVGVAHNVFYADGIIRISEILRISSMQTVILAGVLGMILVSASVFFSTRGIVRNVKRITDSFYHVANDSAGTTLKGENIPTYQTNVLELDILQSALISMMVQLRRTHDLQVKAIESQVEKEKLLASSEAKTNFFATMSHEIRTPMNAILGISEIMLCEGDLTPQQERYVQDIKISSDALLNIINDILDISKLETGKMELHPEHYNFRALMDNIASLAMHLAADANLKFIFKPYGELPLCLYGDGVRLRQILLNLIGNAIKFTRTGSVMLYVFFQGGNLRFDVIDTGIGIRRTELDFLFESFKRIDTRRNREVKGTGLGLSICKNLVELMGGTITVDSIYGRGSTFSVTVPLILGDERKLPQVNIDKGVRYVDSLQVLIVDDNEINLKVSSGLLRAAHGIYCDTALSGQEAIEKVQEKDYDIIFMDHMMPEMDGIDTTQCIRQLGEKYQNIPIIALTANAVIGTQKELIDGGMDDFLAKPIQNERLQEILNTWIPDSKRLPGVAQEEQAQPIAEEAVQGFVFLSEPSVRSHLEREGIDTLAGLENIGFDEDMYLQSLRILKEKIPQTIQVLEDLLEQQNMKEFRVHVHGLKGSLASIGANILAEEAKKLETVAMKDDVDYSRSLLPVLTEKLQHMQETLNEVFPAVERHEGDAAFDEETLQAGLQKLCAALEIYDYEIITNELSVILSMKYDSERSKIVLKIKHCIDVFDYPGAITVIQEEMMAAL